MQQNNEIPLLPPNAETLFRAAFERLKIGQPQRLAKDALVTQNNVAREAGCDPSALRKSRYPTLISEIQYWRSSNQPSAAPSPRQEILRTRKHNRTLHERLAEMKTQRDHANSLLLEANAKILDLLEELDRYHISVPPANVTQIRKPE